MGAAAGQERAAGRAAVGPGAGGSGPAARRSAPCGTARACERLSVRARGGGPAAAGGRGERGSRWGLRGSRPSSGEPLLRPGRAPEVSAAGGGAAGAGARVGASRAAGLPLPGGEGRPCEQSRAGGRRLPRGQSRRLPVHLPAPHRRGQRRLHRCGCGAGSRGAAVGLSPRPRRGVGALLCFCRSLPARPGSVCCSCCCGLGF